MTSPAPRPGPSHRIPLAVFAAIALVLLAVGYWNYRKEAAAIRKEKYEQIAAIGELKSRQIQQWRKERLADAKRFARGPLLNRLAMDFFGNPSAPGYRADLLEQLKLDRMTDQYPEVLLFAPDGRMILSTEDIPAPVDPATQRAVAAALASGDPQLSDFFRQSDGPVQIDTVAAVRNAAGHPTAALILRSRAESYLFPLIQSWPTPSPSAETELIQRDGGEALYLNELRHRSRTALNLRLPLSKADHPVIQAVLGKKGVFLGKDYREVEVLADLRPIPDSPWFMVAKVDAEEILAEARYRAGVISLAVGALILFAAAAVAYAYRHRQAGLFRDLYDSERQQREAQEAFRTILYSIGDAVITTDRAGFIRELNPAAEKLTGWPEAEARGEPLEKVFHVINEETRAAVENPVDQVLRLGAGVALAAQTLLIARDRSERFIADSAAPICDERGEISGVVLVFNDRTSERVAEKELRRSERHLRAIIEAEPECVKLIDSGGNLLDMNPAGLAMLQAESLAEVQEPGLMAFVCPEFHEAFRALNERVMNGEGGKLEFEVIGLKGARRWLETHAVPLRDANGQVLMLLGITRDITERKTAEASLLQRSRQLTVLSLASQHINTVLETPAVMRELVTTAMKLTGGTDGAAARLLDGKMVFEEYNLNGKLMPIDFKFGPGHGVPGWVMNTRAPYMSNDADHDPHVIPEIQKTLGFHNLADVPIINRHGELLGCFEIHNKPGGFNDTDLLMLQGLAASTAIAIENSELLAERKQTAETIRAASQKLMLHFQQSPLGVIEWDTNFRVARWNPAAENIFGFTSQEAVGKPGLFLVPESFRPDAERVMAALLAGEGGQRSTNECVREDGTVITCDWYNTPLVDSDGRVVGVASQVQDITERKTAEARIQRLTQLYLALSQCNQAIVRSTDEGSLFPEICRGAVSLGGMKMAWIGLADAATSRIVPAASCGDQVGYLDGIQVSLDADDPHGRGPTGTAIREDRPFWCQDYEHDPATEPWRGQASSSGWRSSAALPLHRNGKAVGALTLYSGQKNAFDEEARNLLMDMAADISHALDTFEIAAERKRAEAKMAAALAEAQRFREALGHVPAYIYMKDPESRYVYANASTLKLFGCSAEDLPGSDDARFFPPDTASRLREIDLRVLQGEQQAAEIHIPDAKGGHRVYWEVKAPLYEESGRKGIWGLVGISTDITGLKEAEEALRVSLREKESLLKEVHHRVKNNLQVITSLLRLEAGRSNQPDTKSVLKEMQNRIRSMALLHESLYRSENLERVDLPSYINQLTSHLYRSVAVEHGHIQLHLDLAPVSLSLDQAVPCGLLVNELVSNCLKHGFPDGRNGEVRIEIQRVDEGRELRLCVGDTGVGLPADFEEKRASSLGLQLVSDLARQLKGRLEISGAPGQGARFEVTFAPKSPPEA